MDQADGVKLQRVFEAWVAANVSGESPDLLALCGGSEELVEALRARIAIYEALDPALAIDDLESDRRFGGTVTPIGEPAVGDVVGKYRLIRKIGEGGFGDVFEAERLEGFQDRVAMKFLRRGVGSPASRARFAAECQAVARVQHANIASVRDEGVSPNGIPFFVMELIRGRSLTEYCRENAFSVCDRIRLILIVCETIEYAHAKGVIHRDLKPGNILIAELDGVPIPKVIDFGIARIMKPTSELADRITTTGEICGTAAYMSPEQLKVVEGDVDIRSDIYSLGVILYEAVCGVLPYQRDANEKLGVYELQHRMRETEPQTLSSRPQTMHAIAGSQSGKRERRGRMLPRELGWITGKCLELDPGRRYQTCRELAEDLRRYLAEQPLIAGPRSFRYRTRKFVRRHRVWVGAGAFAAVIVLAAASLTAYGLLKALREGERARQAEAEAVSIAEFQAARLAEIDPDQMGIDARIAILEELRPHTEGQSAESGSADKADTNAEAMLQNVNFTNVAMKLLQARLFEPTIRAIDAEYGSNTKIAARLLGSVATGQLASGLVAEAEHTQRRVVETLERRLGRDHPDTLVALRGLGCVLKAWGRPKEGEPLLREAWTLEREVLGDDHLDTLTTLNDLGTVLSDLGRFGEAEAAYREALAGCTKNLGDDHSLTLTVKGNLAGELDQLGRASEAEEYYRAALDGFVRTLGERNSNTILSMNNLGASLYRQGKVEEAEPLFRQSLQLSRDVLGDDHPSTLLAIGNYAVLVERAGRLDEALLLHREACERRTRVLGPDHIQTLGALNNLTSALRNAGQLDEALEIGRRIVERAQAALGVEHWFFGVLQGNFARTVAARGDLAEAARLMIDSNTILVSTLGGDHKRVKDNAGYLADVYELWESRNPNHGHGAEAAKWRAVADGQ